MKVIGIVWNCVDLYETMIGIVWKCVELCVSDWNRIKESGIVCK